MLCKPESLHLLESVHHTYSFSAVGQRISIGVIYIKCYLTLARK